MISRDRGVRQRDVRGRDIGLDQAAAARWPGSRVTLISATGPDSADYLLILPEACLGGEGLTRFLGAVAPFGCPLPPSLVRAYSLPDAIFPSILLGEHEAAPNGVGEAYNRFLAHARRQWMAALEGRGPGLSPALAWRAAPVRRFLTADESADALAKASVTLPGVADHYLGRGLLLLADPGVAESWPTTMSLGGVTKARKITGREFPVWIDLPAHQPSLLASPVLTRVERVLSES